MKERNRRLNFNWQPLAATLISFLAVSCGIVTPTEPVIPTPIVATVDNPTIAATKTHIATSTNTSVATVTQTETATATLTNVPTEERIPIVRPKRTLVPRVIPPIVAVHGSSSAERLIDQLKNSGFLKIVQKVFPQVINIISFGKSGAFAHDLANTFKEVMPNLPPGARILITGARNDGKFLGEAGSQTAVDVHNEIVNARAIYGKDSVLAEVLPFPVEGSADFDAQLKNALQNDPTLLDGVPLVDVGGCGLEKFIPAGDIHFGSTEGYEYWVLNMLEQYSNGTCYTGPLN